MPDVKRLLNERSFLTSAGTETYLVFQQGFDLPEFCAFTVFDAPDAWSELQRNFLFPILDATAANGCGLLLDALVWRAQPDFIVKVGRQPEELEAINRLAVQQSRNCVDAWRQATGHDAGSVPVLIIADVGPRGDGYRIEDVAGTVDASKQYHTPQVRCTADAGVDLVCALTMTSAAESVGIVEASRDAGLEVIVSPTVETDGRLPEGTRLGEFIDEVDARTGSYPLFYMVNCAHPMHLEPALDEAQRAGAAWLKRFGGFRANASRKSHEELDNSTELDRGDPDELARAISDMKRKYNLTLVGGCCGTDHEHLARIASITTQG